jgi:short-subunit dehydrogenase
MTGQAKPNPIYAQRSALITGASSGIGAAFAEALAAAGCRLVLTARRIDRLRALAQRLGERYGTECLCIEADLAEESALDSIELRLRAQSIDIDILINNAGYGIPGQFHKHAWPLHAEFLQVLLIRPTELVHRFLPGMQQRGWGRIVNVASLAGLIPGSNGNTLYAASKAYLIKFSQSLALENRQRGIIVQALCPGFTESEFHDVSGARHLMQRLPKFMFQSAEAVVAEGLLSLERGQVVHVSGRINRLLAWVAKHAPERLALYLIERRSKDFRVLD